MNDRGFRAVLGLLLMVLLLGGCGGEGEPVAVTPRSQDDQHFTVPPPDTRILALGDSYVIGQSVTHEQRWPNVLAAKLREQGVEAGAPLIMAFTGYTTGDLLELLEKRPVKGTFDLVLLQVGAHNQDQDLSTSGYRLELARLIDDAIEYANGDPQHVIVLSIPDWSVTPWARRNEKARIREEIDRFNVANRDEARKAGVHWVNVTAQSRLAARRPELISEDDLHPSGAMYELWVRELLPLATQIMGGEYKAQKANGTQQPPAPVASP